MKPPLVALLMAPVYHDAVECGDKIITIREGHRDYEADQTVMICCHIASWCVMGKIARVVHSELREVSPSDLEMDGFMNHEEALAVLRGYYPHMEMTSPVTVIEFEV